jgi:hypothetical protein
MKDARQKDWLHRHFRTRGWYAVIEVSGVLRTRLPGPPGLHSGNWSSATARRNRERRRRTALCGCER